MKLRAIQKKGKDKSWVIYYNFLRRYADVNYAYAITAHKSQGSTYNTTFVLEDDIDMNINIVERNRIKYTAYTRASKKLYVLKRF
jgi:exodeoxyribonuclease-5